MERNDEPQAGPVPKGTFGQQGRPKARVDDTQRTFAPRPYLGRSEGEAWHEPGLESRPPQLDPPPVAVKPSGRVRVATLVGIPSAPPELLEEARAQRGSHPTPPSYDDLRSTLAAQEASLDSLDMPFSVAPSRSAEPPGDALDTQVDVAFEPWDDAEPPSATPLSAVLEAEEAAEEYLGPFTDEVTPLRSSAPLAAADWTMQGKQSAAPPHASEALASSESLVAGATRPPSPPPTRANSGVRPRGQESVRAAAALGMDGAGSLAPSERGRAGTTQSSAKDNGRVWPVALAAAVALVGAFGWAYTRPGSQVAAASTPVIAAAASPSGIVRGADMAAPETSVSAVQLGLAEVVDMPSQPAETASSRKLPSVSTPAVMQAPTPRAAPKTVAPRKGRSVADQANRPGMAAAIEPAEAVALAPALSAPVSLEPSAPPVLRIVPMDSPQDPGRSELPDRSDVQQAMQSVRGKVSACVSRGGGVAQVTVTALSSGKLNHVLVGGDFAGTPEGSCIARAVRTARLPAFSKPLFEFTYPFSF